MLRGLGSTRVKIAFDEWNLRGWHHPSSTVPAADIGARDLNDLNSTYTCADAVYAGCLLNACLRHADTVGMANFAPIVNSRGAIFTHKDGMVLRPTYHVFDLYANHALPLAMAVAVESDLFMADGAEIPLVDAAMTRADDGRYTLAAVNRHDRLSAQLALKFIGCEVAAKAERWTVHGAETDSFNDITHPRNVTLTKSDIPWKARDPVCVLPPHSVNMICFTLAP
jgi:alpha-N-arabinofuranosidase